jgi:hypothetical protein
MSEEEPEYLCDDCSEAFDDEDELANHMAEDHPKSLDEDD